MSSWRKNMTDSPQKSVRSETARDEVSIEINGVSLRIHRGHQTVSAIKAAGGVAQADELEQVIGGKLQPLDDAGAVVLKGEEVFVSHPRDSGSSGE
jgi:hypothetical protein